MLNAIRRKALPCIICFRLELYPFNRLSPLVELVPLSVRKFLLEKNLSLLDAKDITFNDFLFVAVLGPIYKKGAEKHWKLNNEDIAIVVILNFILYILLI